MSSAFGAGARAPRGLVVDERRPQHLELLERPAVGAAEQLVADGLVVERVDRVRHEHADARRA